MIADVSRQPSSPSDASGPRVRSDSPPDPRTTSSPSACSRRALLALAGGGLSATSGCLSALGSSGESNADVALTTERLAFEDGFGPEVASLAGTYGEHGVWGQSEGPGVDGPTYVGAYRDSISVPGDDGSGVPESWVTADVAAVVYRLDGDERAYRVWLWAGARANQPDGGLGRASVTRVSVGAAAGRGWTLDGYAPRGAFREGPVPVSLGERGPSGRTPLHGGGIAPDDGGRTGGDGRFGVAWQGIARDVRSANAVCEFGPASGEDRPFEARATFGVAGGRGVL